MRYSYLNYFIAVLVLMVGCANSPEVMQQRAEREARISELLSQPLDSAQYGETKRCLSDHDYRDFRALDDRRILFEGRRGKMWLNTLNMRCPELRHGSVLRVKAFSSGRLCSHDVFQVADWFDWPWYRRWPWQWGSAWGTGINCSLGEFQPVSDDQVTAIEAILKGR